MCEAVQACARAPGDVPFDSLSGHRSQPTAPSLTFDRPLSIPTESPGGVWICRHWAPTLPLRQLVAPGSLSAEEVAQRFTKARPRIIARPAAGPAPIAPGQVTDSLFHCSVGPALPSLAGDRRPGSNRGASAGHGRMPGTRAES